MRFPAKLLSVIGVCLALSSAATSLNAQKTVLPLNGVWVVTAQSQTSNLTVPASLPFFGGTSVWKRSFALNLGATPAVAYLEFDGIANTATVLLNGAQVGTLTAFTHTRLDVRNALKLQGTNTLELDIGGNS